MSDAQCSERTAAPGGIPEVAELRQEQPIISWIKRRIPDVKVGARPNVTRFYSQEGPYIHIRLLVSERCRALVSPSRAIFAAIAVKVTARPLEAEPNVW